MGRYLRRAEDLGFIAADAAGPFVLEPVALLSVWADVTLAVKLGTLVLTFAH